MELYFMFLKCCLCSFVLSCPVLFCFVFLFFFFLVSAGWQKLSHSYWNNWFSFEALKICKQSPKMIYSMLWTLTTRGTVLIHMMNMYSNFYLQSRDASDTYITVLEKYWLLHLIEQSSKIIGWEVSSDTRLYSQV